MLARPAEFFSESGDDLCVLQIKSLWLQVQAQA